MSMLSLSPFGWWAPVRPNRDRLAVEWSNHREILNNTYIRQRRYAFARSCLRYVGGQAHHRSQLERLPHDPASRGSTLRRVVHRAPEVHIEFPSHRRSVCEANAYGHDDRNIKIAKLYTELTLRRGVAPETGGRGDVESDFRVTVLKDALPSGSSRLFAQIEPGERDDQPILAWSGARRRRRATREPHRSKRGTHGHDEA